MDYKKHIETKNQFRKWMKQEEVKKDSTVYSYSLAIYEIIDHQYEIQHYYDDLYDIENITLSDLQKLSDDYDTKGKYKKIGAINNGTIRAAIKAYVRFYKNYSYIVKKGEDYKKEFVWNEDEKSKHKITMEQVKKCYEFAKKVEKGILDKNGAGRIIHDDYGMDEGSARMYIDNYLRLRTGTIFGVTMKKDDLRYFVSQLYTDFGKDGLNKALNSLRLFLVKKKHTPTKKVYDEFINILDQNKGAF